MSKIIFTNIIFHAIDHQSFGIYFYDNISYLVNISYDNICY